MQIQLNSMPISILQGYIYFQHICNQLMIAPNTQCRFWQDQRKLKSLHSTLFQSFLAGLRVKVNINSVDASPMQSGFESGHFSAEKE